MNNEITNRPVLDYLQSIAKKPLSFDEKAIDKAYRNVHEKQSLAIKILSVFGGILASTAFLGFLFITGLYDAPIGLVVFGLLFIAGAVALSRVYDTIILDTFSVSFFIIGLWLFGFGCSQLKLSNEVLSVLFFIIAILALTVVRNYILTFITTLLASGSILSFMISSAANQLVHAYVAIMALLLAYFFLNEAKIIGKYKNMVKRYEPIRIGLVFSFLSGLVLLGKKGLLPNSHHMFWLSSAVVICTILYLLAHLLEILAVVEVKLKCYIYFTAILLLAPTALAPAISGAVLIMLLCFFVNYRTGFSIGIMALLYFITQYYYDLSFTLLTKSILLFASGMLLLIVYLFFYRKRVNHEKV